MNIQHWITLVAGLIYGYAFLAVIASSFPLANEFLRAGRPEFRELLWTRYISYLLTAFFLITVFFGSASYWIEMMAEAGGGDRQRYVGLWFRAFVAGLLSSMLVPLVESSISRQGKKKQLRARTR